MMEGALHREGVYFLPVPPCCRQVGEGGFERVRERVQGASNSNRSVCVCSL